MPASEKNRLAAEAMDRWEDFQISLSSEKRECGTPVGISKASGSGGKPFFGFPSLPISAVTSAGLAVALKLFRREIA
jgi:hypothetical protein